MKNGKGIRLLLHIFSLAAVVEPRGLEPSHLLTVNYAQRDRVLLYQIVVVVAATGLKSHSFFQISLRYIKHIKHGNHMGKTNNAPSLFCRKM